MIYVLQLGKKFLAFSLIFFSMRIVPIVVNPAMAWYNYWITHRTHIVFLAAINTALTTASEVGSRTLVPKLKGIPNEGFLVKTPEGETRIHRQSLINILMTFLASILGGPVYFIQRRNQRFLFFISFGIFNSYLAQLTSSVLLEGYFHIAIRRIYFDFFYNATIKFFMFEYVRPMLLKHRNRPDKVIGFRIGQDFLTSSARVVILNYFNLRGL